ncbi:MAG: ribosome biogenesis GTPase Der [Acidimicrobiales bacterium]|nr:ribosome biogenesis GTPase Der [Acidimicrobiales bacterium]
MSDLPMVAIVGRPNVGKSTLLNRIIGRREAIVEELPGVTRDRKEVEAEWTGTRFRLVDTGGWMPGGSSLDEKVSRQSEKAMAEADALIVVADVTMGVTEEDARIADLLRQCKQPVFVVANKVDDPSKEPAMWELLSLGLGNPYPLSALHGAGTGDLLDAVVAVLPTPGEDSEEPAEVQDDSQRIFSVALVGRPNVGKSTLFNRLIGEDRSVVHDMAGTTRDAIDTVIETPDGPIRFVDTAGMRRKSRIDEGTEYYSFVRALQAVDSSDVALLVIDATESITHQDQRLAERIDAAGCPIVIVLNKYELLDTEQKDAVSYDLRQKLAFLGDSDVIRISALTGKNVQRLLPMLTTAIEGYHKRVPTRRVNDVVFAAQSAQPAPHGARILYATQGATDPPTFTLFANKELPATYLRYIERKLREEFQLGSTPIKLRVRQRAN